MYEITPQEYGEFLCEVLDEWYNNGTPVTSVRYVDNMLSVYLNRETESCVHRASCPENLVLEQNGDAYPCDFFISNKWSVGNVAIDSIPECLAIRTLCASNR